MKCQASDYSMSAFRLMLLCTAFVWSLAADVRADFITGYAWRTVVANDDLAMPSTLASNTCHLKSDNITTEPCLPSNADLTFTTEGIGFHTPSPESPSLQTFGQFLNTNATHSPSYPINNKSYRNGVNDATILDTVIFKFEGLGTFTGTPASPQRFTFAHDDGLTFTVNSQIVVNKPDRTSPITSTGAYTGGAGNHLPFQLIYTECCTPPAVLETDLVGPTADPNPLTLTNLNPASTAAGGPLFTLTAMGTGFVSDSVLMWNGSARPTTLDPNSPGTKLSAQISAADIATAGTASVNVVNAAEGATSNALTFTITPPVILQPIIQFNSATYGVMENAGAATITVTRMVDTTGTSTVQFATADGTAKSGVNYVGVSGTLTFNPTDTSKTFDVPMINDGLADGSKTVNLALSSPTGAILGTPNQATLTITDVGAPNPPPPAPFISELVPYSAPVDFGLSFTLRVLGSGFAPAAQVFWNGTPLSVISVSPSEIDATVNPGIWSNTPGSYPIMVANPGPVNSNQVMFTVLPVGSGNPPPFVVHDPMANPNPTYGNTTNLTVLGGTLSPGGESVLTYDWEPVGAQPAAVTFSANKSHSASNITGTFSGSGIYHLQVTITDTFTGFSVLTKVLDVSVNLKAASLKLSADKTIITPDQTVKLTVVVKDQFGYDLPNPTIVWNNDAGSLAPGSSPSNFLTVDATVRKVHITATLSTDSNLTGSVDIVVIFGSGGVGTLDQVRLGPVPFKSTSGLPGVKFTGLPLGARIRIFATDGRLVQTLTADTSGEKTWTLTNSSANRVASGVYVYIIDFAGQKKEGKLVLIL